MTIYPATLNESPTGVRFSNTEVSSLTTHRLRNQDEPEVLEFLRERPVHTAVMSGFIRDNGMENMLNRGYFYACRNSAGLIQGVALIGHGMFIEARCDEALKEFARLAQGFGRTHMIMGEQKMIERFWAFYAAGGQLMRHAFREVLFELNEAPVIFVPIPGLRPAEPADLSMLVPLHASLAVDESGIDPLARDPDGFRRRCQRRIEQGRVRVLIEGGEVIFKADIISDTPDAIYVEGVYVHPHRRGQGYGSRCLAQMSGELLERTKSISLLVDEHRHLAQRFFQKSGFVARGYYETIFLQERISH